jgi:hypothetical protein
MGRFAEAAKKAANMTNKQLQSELSTVGTLDQNKIQELLPLKQDKQAFIELMKEVEAETTVDQKIAFLQNNVSSAGKVAFTLLKALA